MSFCKKSNVKKYTKKHLKKSLLYENENKYKKKGHVSCFKSETYVIVEITKPISKKEEK